MDNLDALFSDGENYEQDGNDVKFVRDGGKVELELVNKQLAFKFCSRGCMGKTVTACYDSINPNPKVRGKCGAGQCEFNATVVDQGGITYLRFMTTGFHKISNNNDNVCGTATMASPEAIISLDAPAVASCEPLFIDGKVIKLTLLGANHNCPLYVENAKKWTPPPTATTQNSSGTTVPNQTTSKSSEANTTLWIGIGVGIFILLIVIIGFGYCCYRTQIQKQPLFGKKKEVQQKAFIPEASKKPRAVENEKIEDEKEVVAKPEPSKEATVAKEKQPKPAKEKIPKEKKAPILVPKPSKEVTQEDAPPAKKVSAEPTLEVPTTETFVVQKSVIQQQKQHHNGNPPKVYVPKTVIHPEPKSVNAPKSGSLKTGKKDSLSGRHEIGMEFMVESGPEHVKRRDINIRLLNKETKEKLEKFYPPGPFRSFDRREIEILCCARISIMFKTIEMLM
uniref:Uncharacterized protein n=1 Tax=Panagrolaimus davidi TaxID=227884 RepID=A0A914QVD6_9BILA